MHLILQLDKPEDFVIATGKKTSLKEFVKKAFEYFDLDFNNYVKSDESMFRPTDIINSFGDATKAKEILNWKAKSGIDDIIKMMIQAELIESNLFFEAVAV